MAANTMADRLRKGEVLLGVCNMYPSAGLAELVCKGWDFLWVDGQHGQMSYDSCLHALHAATASGVEVLLRVPGHEHGILGPMADLSPAAVMVPMVNNAAEAKFVVDGLRFPPLGKRSYGGRRVIDLHGRDYYRQAELLVVAQIETLEAAQNAEAIINTDGIDALFFGPDDMKVRMDLPIDTAVDSNDQLREAMKKTAAAARRAGKFAGSVTATPKALAMAVELGYQLLVGGGDVPFLRTLASQRLAELRQVLGANTATPTRKGSDVYGS